jgi:hypothetical protein
VVIREYTHSLNLIRKYLLLLGCSIFLLQIMLDSTSMNIYTNLLAVAPFILACCTIFQPINQRIGRALTGAAVFLAITANSLAPMLGTLSEGNPITYSLMQPVETFFHRFLFALALLSAHFLTVIVSASKKGGFLSTVGSLANARILASPRGIWVLGAMGFFVKEFTFSNCCYKVVGRIWVSNVGTVSPVSSSIF